MKYSQTVTWQNGGTRARWTHRQNHDTMLSLHYSHQFQHHQHHHHHHHHHYDQAGLASAGWGKDALCLCEGELLQMVNRYFLFCLYFENTLNGENILSLFFSFSFFEILQLYFETSSNDDGRLCFKTAQTAV